MPYQYQQKRFVGVQRFGEKDECFALHQCRLNASRYLPLERGLMARLLIVMALVFMGVATRAQTPATLTSLGTNAPTPGLYDVSQLLISGQTNKPDTLNY